MLPLNTVVAGQHDGRTVSGLQKRVTRLTEDDENENKEKSEDTRMVLSILSNYLKVVRMCEAFATSNIRTMEASLLKETLEVFQAEQVTLPLRMMKDLVRRRSEELVKAEKWQELLQATVPFNEPSAFDPLNPVLSSLPCDTKSKVMNWAGLIFQRLMVDWIKLGQAGSGRVLTFSKLGLDALNQVQLMDVDAGPAKECGEEKVVFRALIAVLTVGYKTTFQAWPCESGGDRFFFFVLLQSQKARKAITKRFFFFFLGGGKGDRRDLGGLFSCVSPVGCHQAQERDEQDHFQHIGAHCHSSAGTGVVEQSGVPLDEGTSSEAAVGRNDFQPPRDIAPGVALYRGPFSDGADHP